jgi:hypothetical protein
LKLEKNIKIKKKNKKIIKKKGRKNRVGAKLDK